jgi:hypothetical protein
MLPVNRFQAMARLGSVYLVDQVGREDWNGRIKINRQCLVEHRIQSRKQYIGTSNLDRYMAQDDENNSESRESDDDSDEVDSNDGNPDEMSNKRKTFLSSSVHGSRRHLKRLANNALEVVSELGPPTLFITLTCNPEWEEIRFMLLQGQTAFDRPDVVVRVFNAKLKAFIEDVRTGKYFDGLAVIYMFRVIENQTRGMPHASNYMMLQQLMTAMIISCLGLISMIQNIFHLSTIS